MLKRAWLAMFPLLMGCALIQQFVPATEQQGAYLRPMITSEVPSETPLLTPTPTPLPRTLTVCMGAEPDTLYIYGGQMLAQQHILEAIYDGPIDTHGYEFQPVILEKLPDLENGDALVEPVTVKEGDWVVNDAGQRVILAIGEKVRPYGCTQTECAMAWDGSPLEMAQLSATFTLLEGIRWSDGTPLTAEDSVFSYQIARNCQSQWGRCSDLGLIPPRLDTVERTASYTALDERTVRWVGLPGFLDAGYRTNFFRPLPKHQLSRYTPSELFEAEKAVRSPLGWGAYAIEKWEPGQYIRLHRNPFYFRAEEGLPKFDTLIFRFIGKDPKTNLEALASGECDVLDQEASLALLGEEMETALAMDQAGKLRAYIVPSTVWEHADFSIRPLAYDDGYQPGVDRPDFFGDVRVRRAIALCMDRQQIVGKVLHGLSSVPDSYIPHEHPLYNPNVARYPFDVAAGSALLQEVGWVDHDGNPTTPRIAQGVANIPDGTPFEFTYVTTTAQQRQQAAQILANSLAQCGLRVNLDFIEPNELFAEGPQGHLFGRRFEMAQFAWMTGVTPPCQLYLSEQISGDPNLLDENNQPIFPYGWSGTNLTGYSNPEYDRACRTALATLPGQPDYLENHLKAQEIFADELPVVPLYVRLKAAATRDDLCGFTMDASTYSEFWNIESFDYGEGCP